LHIRPSLSCTKQLDSRTSYNFSLCSSTYYLLKKRTMFWCNLQLQR
jgi:hypothetical protein